MKLKKKLIAAVTAALVAVGPASADPDEPYNNTTVDPNADSWMDGIGPPSIESFAQMLSRIGAFVVGTDPSDPGLGPLLTALMVGGVVLGLVGTSRSGAVASATVGVTTLAVLTLGAGMVPTWLYGSVVVILGLMATAVFLRLVR